MEQVSLQPGHQLRHLLAPVMLGTGFGIRRRIAHGQQAPEMLSFRKLEGLLHGLAVEPAHYAGA